MHHRDPPTSGCDYEPDGSNASGPRVGTLSCAASMLTGPQPRLTRTADHPPDIPRFTSLRSPPPAHCIEFISLIKK